MATKSPIYTLFSETSTPSGLATIRGLNRQELFIDMNIGRLNRSQQPYFYLQAIRRWLQTWTNILALIINVALVAIVVLLRNTKSIGVLGAGLVQATQISSLLNQSLISFTELEIASVALERVLNFAKLPEEQSAAVNGKLRVKVEPQDVKGQIEFRNVSVSYRAGLKPSLRDLSLTIKSGEKLGICGRSGSGKSTLLLAIFAMLEANQGEIYLDNQPVSTLSAFSLRNSLTIVPQNALILTATVRDNLDPSRSKPDTELWNALETCKLLQVVKTFPDGLDTKLANDINLSSGQRQLFSMARALLRNRKVLVLDEATSSMDYETDAAVQQILRSQFNHCTIITVAHRIATVRDYDRILVLSNGQMVELDTPDNLMKQSNSIFRSLATEQGVC
jgi:ATP-binding cassette subfamily C (CFTR/MRP) protein 1